MTQEIEYHDAMVTILELIWGDGFMAPGGKGNVDNLVEGLDVRNKSILDIGSGLGGPAFVLAKGYGASVMDFFRFDDIGKIIEHWGSIQGIPANTKNGNPMY